MGEPLPTRLARVDSGGIVFVEGRACFFTHYDDAATFFEGVTSPKLVAAHILRLAALDLLLEFENTRHALAEEGGAPKEWGPVGDAVLAAAAKLQRMAQDEETEALETQRNDGRSDRDGPPATGAQAA